MKGKNDLILNEATIIEAVQFWLDSKMVKNTPTVTSVKSAKDGYSMTFIVSLDADADRPDVKQDAGCAH